jgi:hypothetical protein
MKDKSKKKINGSMSIVGVEVFKKASTLSFCKKKYI